MNIHFLKLFCLVIETGNISQVARLSYVSQPTVSNQIRRIEQHFDIRLFNRIEGRLIPTEAGNQLYPFAKDIVYTLEKSQDTLKNLTSYYESYLSIVATLTIGNFLIPEIIGDFQRKFPNINVNLHISNTPNTLSKLKKDNIDLALVEGIVADEQFSITKFSEDELVIALPKNHKWGNYEKISIEKIPEEKMIWREPNSGIRKIIEKIFWEYNILHKITSKIELGSSQAIKTAIEKQLGISILPKISIQKEINDRSLNFTKIKEVKMNRNLSIVKKTTRFPKENVNKFISFLFDSIH